ncbi:MAG: hypothetical protein NTW85_08400 [Methylococcales bacterium]|nr:hypothetical protein [Methylococcales bacterium]
MTNAQLPVTIDNDTGTLFHEDSQEKIIEELFNTEDNAEKTSSVIADFVASYSQHKNAQPLEEWLNQQFSNYPELWSDDKERKETAQQIITSVQQANETKADLVAHLDKGKSRESWLARKIEQGASSAGVVNVGEYARSIDNALETATETMKTMIFNKTKNAENILAEISNAPQLHGFIAEADLANQFNINAATSGSTLKAEVPSVTTLDSPDIVIKNATGDVIEKIQVKLYDPENGLANLKQNIRIHDYSDTTLVVNKEHVAALREEFPDLKITSEYQRDGVKMEMGEYADYKKQQEQAQQEAEIKQYDWNDANRMNIAKEIGKKALIGAAFSAGFQGARILGRRVWNKLTGKENQTANEDLKEFFESSIKSSACVGVQVAVSGALVVAVKSGWIKVLQNTPAGQLANIAYIGLENAKCLFKFAKGELTADETLDAMGNTTCWAVGGIYGAIEGAALGAKIGALTVNPVGIAIGSFIGAVVGGIAGSAIAEPLYEGSKAIVKTAAKVIESAWQGTKSLAKTALNKLTFGLFA